MLEIQLNEDKKKEEQISLNYRTYYAKNARELAFKLETIHRYAIKTPVRGGVLLKDLSELHTSFLQTTDHILFFNKEEIRLIADLEQSLGLSNGLILKLKESAQENLEEKIDPEIFSDRTFFSIKMTYDLSIKLSKRLDPQKWESYNKKINSIPLRFSAHDSLHLFSLTCLFFLLRSKNITSTKKRNIKSRF